MSNDLPTPQSSKGEAGPENENYISVDEVIRRLKDRGISLGRGDPYHTLRYYTKIGLLPHMIRKLPCPEATSTTGHYPESVIETLQEIVALKAQGFSNVDIKRHLQVPKGRNLEEQISQTAEKLASEASTLIANGTNKEPPPIFPPSFFALPEAIKNIGQALADFSLFARNMIRRPYPQFESNWG